MTKIQMRKQETKWLEAAAALRALPERYGLTVEESKLARAQFNFTFSVMPSRSPRDLRWMTATLRFATTELLVYGPEMGIIQFCTPAMALLREFAD